MPEIHNLNAGKIDVIGHGGSGFQSFENPYPANSFASIVRAIDGMNADGIEVDVQLSADSVLVLFHDSRLERLTDGDGFVYEKNLNYLLNCRYRKNFNVNITMNEKIIILEKILTYFDDYYPKPMIYLDIKLYHPAMEYLNKFARKLVRLINEFNAQEWVNIQSYSLEFLKSATQEDSTLMLYLKAPERATTVRDVRSNNLKGIVILFDSITKKDVDDLHQLGIFVVLYGKESRKNLKAAVARNPDAIQTDNIPVLQSLLY